MVELKFKVNQLVYNTRSVTTVYSLLVPVGTVGRITDASPINGCYSVDFGKRYGEATLVCESSLEVKD